MLWLKEDDVHLNSFIRRCNVLSSFSHHIGANKLNQSFYIFVVNSKQFHFIKKAVGPLWADKPDSFLRPRAEIQINSDHRSYKKSNSIHL